MGGRQLKERALFVPRNCLESAGKTPLWRSGVLESTASFRICQTVGRILSGDVDQMTPAGVTLLMSVVTIDTASPPVFQTAAPILNMLVGSTWPIANDGDTWVESGIRRTANVF